MLFTMLFIPWITCYLILLTYIINGIITYY